MSESTETGGPNGPFASGAGRRLAEAREAKGLSVAQVAEQLKLTVRQIEALEAEDRSRLPAMVFVRGFVKNYARLVDLPPESLLDDGSPTTVATETITAPSEGLRYESSTLRRWLLLPLVGFALFMLLVAILYAWLSRGEEAYVPDTPHAAVPGAAPAAPPAPVTAPPAVEPAPPAPPGSGPADSSSIQLPTPVPSPPPTAPTAPPRAATPAFAPAAPAPAPAVAPPAPARPANAVAPQTGETGAVIQFVAGEDAWIEVVSADNRRFARLIRSGEQLALRGTPPFKLVVGNAANVQLSYKGRIIDTKPYIGDKVARLTLE